MRNAFAGELTKLAAENDKLVLLSGDIGNRLFDNFKSVAPNRFVNCGVAEANMMSVAAGMAMSGLKPVVYTIAPFVTARCYEQIKLDICYHNVPAVIVGTGAGLSYASLGPTHHSCEDIAILKVLPHMTIICPGDAHEVRLALRESIKIAGPVYIRLGKKGEPVIHKEEPRFTIGKGIIMQEGHTVSLLSTGNMLATAMECAEELAKQSISTQVVSLHTVKPLDYDLIQNIFSKFQLIATIEEHFLSGGLGSSIAEWKARQTYTKAKLLTFGVADEFMHTAGNQKYARQYFGLSTEKIVSNILHTLNTKESK